MYKCAPPFHLYRNLEISESDEKQPSPRSLWYPCRTDEIWWGSDPSLAPRTVFHSISYRTDTKRQASGHHSASLETERQSQNLLQLSWHHTPLCAQEALCYDPPGPLYHFPQKLTKNPTGWLHARKVHRGANIHNAAADRKDSRIPTKSMCCLC